uniref:Myb-like domain-containing protein n=1 Tax=Kalanchoe fedtschenkoi TaxID=63787 RepID=A0A7N0U2L6_KALFE
MERHRRKQPRIKQQQQQRSYSEEVSSLEWEFISMSEQEEDLIHRMYKLVGPRWALIAGRIPGRKPEEVERFWIMRHGEVFANRRRELKQRHYNHNCSSSSNNNNNNNE